MKRAISHDTIGKIVDMAQNTNLTQAQIGQALGVCHMTVNKYIKLYGLPQQRRELSFEDTEKKDKDFIKNIGKIRAIKDLMNTFEIGEQLEITRRKKVLYGTLLQKSRHQIFLQLEDGKRFDISDFQLVTEEIIVRKVS